MLGWKRNPTAGLALMLSTWIHKFLIRLNTKFNNTFYNTGPSHTLSSKTFTHMSMLIDCNYSPLPTYSLKHILQCFVTCTFRGVTSLNVAHHLSGQQYFHDWFTMSRWWYGTLTVCIATAANQRTVANTSRHLHWYSSWSSKIPFSYCFNFLSFAEDVIPMQ